MMQELVTPKRSTDFLIFKAQIINLRIPRRSGGIGRHAILRGSELSSCRFKSALAPF